MQETPRFYDSTAFWLLLGALSIGVHGAIAFFLLQNLIRIDLTEPNFIPIELVSLPQEPVIPEPPEATPPKVPPTPAPKQEDLKEDEKEQEQDNEAIATPTPQTPAPISPSPSPSPPPPKPNSQPTPADPPDSSDPNPATADSTASSNSDPAITDPPPDTNSNSAPQPPAAPNPNPDPDSPNQPNSLNVSFGTFELSDPTRDVPDQLGKPQQNQQELEAIAYINEPDLSFTETLILEVVFTIDREGNFDAIQGEIKLKQSNLTTTQARNIAESILKDWQFEPSYMGGQPVYQSYRAQLTIAPIF